MASGRRVTFFLSKIGAVVAAVIVLIALLLSGLRLAINYAPELRAHTESFLSELLDVSLTLGGLRAEWTGRHPRIILEDVVLFDDDGAQALELDELELRVALISSIRNRSPQLAEVSVSGLKLTVEREENGGFRLRGVRDIEVGESSDEEALALAPFSVRLKDVELVYIDRLLGDQIEFGPSQLRLDSRDGRVRVAGALTLPDEIGGAVRFLAAWQGTHDTGAGELYADLDAVRLGELRRWLPVDIADWPAVDGLFSGELWLGAEQGRIVYADGDVALTGLIDGQGVLAQRLGGRFNWRATDTGWRLTVDRSTFAYAGREWPRGVSRIDYQTLPEGRRLSIGADYLRLEDVWRMVDHVPRLETQLRDRILAFGPEGALHRVDAELHWDKAGITDYRVRAGFEALAVEPVGDIPGASGLYGELLAERHGGRMQIEGREGTLTFRQLFRDALPFQQLDGELTWEVFPGRGWQAQSPRLRFTSDDGHANVRVGVFAFEPGNPWLDVRASIDGANASSTWRYLPVSIMAPHLVDWLDKSIQQGRVTRGDVLLFGQARDFPFHNGGGVFEVRAHVEDGRLRYMPNWPSLEALEATIHFRGTAMDIAIAEGRVLDARIVRGRATIPDLLNAELAVSGTFASSGNDVLDFLASSPLGRSIREPIESFSLTGEQRLDLAFTLPLDKPADVRVDGALELDGGVLEMPLLNLRVDRLRGRVTFDERGLEAEELRGFFQRRPLRASATTEADASGERIHVAVDFAGNPVPVIGVAGLAPLLEGYSDWRLRLDLPGFRPQNGSPRVALRLDSLLQGLAVDLPPPFAKPAAQRRLFRLDTHFDADGVGPLHLRYSDLARAALDLGEAGGIERADVRLDSAPPILPRESGIRVSGQIPIVDIAAWAAVGQALTADSAPPEWARDHRPARGVPPLLSADISAEEVLAGKQRFEQQRVLVSARDEAWHARLDGPQLSGRIIVPRGSEGAFEANLERLYVRGGDDGFDWSSEPTNAASDRQDPRRLPSLRVSVADFRWAGRNLGTLSLQAESVSDGLVLSELSLNGGLLNIDAHGDWRWTDGVSETRLQGSARSSNVGAALTLLGMHDTMYSGDGELNTDLAWPGGPLDFSLSSVTGQLGFRIRGGHLPAVQPGAGRVFGLVSVGMLPRRLLFDFSDLFGRGFAFDELRSNLRLEAGEGHLERFTVRGPAARVDATGRIDLVARELDQRVDVMPRVSATLPLVGGLAGGPLGAFAMFITQQLLESEIDRITRYRYHVSGSWDDPDVRRLGREQSPRPPVSDSPLPMPFDLP